MGKESIKRKLQELKVEKIPLDVALGARDLIRDFTLDQVRMVSAGGATFYVWVSVLDIHILTVKVKNWCVACLCPIGYKKRLLLKCTHNCISDLINNKDHMHINAILI